MKKMTHRLALGLGATALVAGTASAAHATAVTGSVSDAADDYTTDYRDGTPPSSMPAKAIDLHKTTIKVSSTRIYGTVTISHIGSGDSTVGEDMELFYRGNIVARDHTAKTTAAHL